jgi:thioredoxin reductase (NADPH)
MFSRDELRSVPIFSELADKELDIPALDRLRGRGIYYGAAPGEETSVQGKDIFLVGGGNSAGQAAVNLADHARSVTLLVRGEGLASSMSRYLIEQLKTKSNVHVETRSMVVDDHRSRDLCRGGRSCRLREARRRRRGRRQHGDRIRAPVPGLCG